MNQYISITVFHIFSFSNCFGRCFTTYRNYGGTTPLCGTLLYTSIVCPPNKTEPNVLMLDWPVIEVYGIYILKFQYLWERTMGRKISNISLPNYKTSRRKNCQVCHKILLLTSEIRHFCLSAVSETYNGIAQYVHSPKNFIKIISSNTLCFILPSFSCNGLQCHTSYRQII